MLSTIITQRQVWISTIAFSALITLLSLGLSTLLHYFFNQSMGTIGVVASVFVPSIIAPFALYKFLSLIRTLNLTRTKLETTSRQDYLTGIFNRRYVEESAQRTFSLSKRHGFSVSVILLDLDHFKDVNDTHGHAVGDKVLIELTKCIDTIIRKTDIFGRFGGEEFILFMPHTTLDQATFLAERIRTEIAELQIEINGPSVSRQRQWAQPC